MSKKKTTKEFISESIIKHGSKYDYSKVVYVNNKVKIKVICPTHGEWEQRPNDHLTGYGCKECGYKEVSKKVSAVKMAKQKTYSEWKIYVHDKFHNLSIVSMSDYSVKKGMSKLRCNIHKIDFRISNEVMSKKTSKLLCPICIRMNHQKQTFSDPTGKATVYLAWFKNIDMYKLGVTKNINDRFSEKHLVLDKLELDTVDAIEFESWFHNRNSKYRYSGTKKLLSVGNTELYKVNIFDDLTTLYKAYRDSVDKSTV